MVSDSEKKKAHKKGYDEGYSKGFWQVGLVVEQQLDARKIDKVTLAKAIGRADHPAGTADNVAANPESPLEPIAVAEEEPSPARAMAEKLTPIASAPATVTPAPQVVKPVKTKQQITERNLNILLYVASFLIVAAAAAFIATSMPPLVRLVSLWLVIMAFYGAGTVLHAKVAYLRPAATAFIGTGLALVPFAGIALSQLGNIPGGIAWLITSVIGVASYAYATMQLRSAVVSYLTVAFVLSLAVSSVAAVSGPVVFYFVALIVLSLIFHLLAHFKVQWIPELFKVPITQASQVVTPLTLVASVFALPALSLGSYQIIFWTTTAFYGVLWVTEKRIVYEQLTRVVISIALYLTIANLFNFEVAATLLTVIGISVAQAAYSLARVRLDVKQSRLIEASWIVVVMTVLFMALPVWFSLPDLVRWGVTAQLSTLALVSVAAAWRLKAIFFAAPAALVSLLLPLVIGRWPGHELFDFSFIPLIYGLMIAAVLAISYVVRGASLSVRSFFQFAFWLYIVGMFIASSFQASSVVELLATGALVLFVAVASYVYRLWFIEIVAALLLIKTVGLVGVVTDIPLEWQIVFVIGITSVVYAGAAVLHAYLKENARKITMVIAALVLGLGLVFVQQEIDTVVLVGLVMAAVYGLVSVALRIKAVFSPTMRTVATVSYAVYPLVALFLASGLGAGWVTGAFALAAATYWVGSHLDKQPLVLVFANMAIIGMVYTLWAWLDLDETWLSFGVSWAVAAIVYLAGLVYWFSFQDKKRYYINTITAWVVLAPVTLMNVGADGMYGYAAAGTLIAVAGTMALHGVIVQRTAVIEAAMYVATFGLQRIVAISFPAANIALFGHWWALVLVFAAWWRKGRYITARLVIAAACVTVGSGIMALASGGGYQILFLVEHVALLVTGVLTRTSWALWWGLIATVLAVLYFLRSSLFLSLLFLGLTLLGIVIWRLKRANRTRE